MATCLNCDRPVPGQGERVCRRALSCPVATGDVDPESLPAGTWRTAKDGGR